MYRFIIRNLYLHIISNICYLNSIIKSNKLSYPKIRYSGKKSDYMRNEITNFIDSIKNIKPIILRNNL